MKKKLRNTFNKRSIKHSLETIKTILKKKNKAEGHILPDFKLNYETMVKDSLVLAQGEAYRSME